MISHSKKILIPLNNNLEINHNILIIMIKIFLLLALMKIIKINKVIYIVKIISNIIYVILCFDFKNIYINKLNIFLLFF